MTSLARALVGLALWVYDHPWPAVGLWLAALVVGGLGLPQLPLDTSLEGMLGEHAPEVLAAESIADRFGRDAGVVVAFGAPDVFAPDALDRLNALAADLRKVPGTDEVISVLDLPLVRSNGGRLQVDRALRPWPTDLEDLSERTAALRSCRACRAGWVSPDGSLALIGLFTEDGAPRGTATERAAAAARAATLVDGVDAVLARHATPGVRLGISGKVAMVDALYRELTANLFGFVAGAIAASAILLWVLFRSPAGVLVPGLVMISPLVLTLGAMGALGVPLQLVSAALAPLIIVVSVAGTVHVLTALDRERARGTAPRDALRWTLERKAEALLLSGLTTSGALLALGVAGLEPLANVGRFGAFGTAVGVLSSLVVVPAALRLWPWAPVTRASGLHVSGLQPLLARLGAIAIGHTWAVLVVSALALGASGLLASQLRLTHAPLDWLPASWEVRQGTEWIDSATHASMALDLVLDAGVPGGAQEPAFLARVDAFQRAIPARLDGGLEIGAVSSLVDALQMVRDGLGEGDPASGRAAGRLERDLRLLEIADPAGMRRLISADGRQLRVSIRTEVAEAGEYVELVALTRALAAAHLGPAVRVEEGGLIPVFARTLEVLQTSTVRSYALALVVLLTALVALVRDLRLGLLMMLPNLLPVTAVGAWMWLWGIPLDTFTVLTVSLAIGLVVDDTLHLISELQMGIAEHQGDVDAACRAALRESGPAMLVTSLVLVAGWAVLLQSDLRSVTMFAWLGSTTLLCGLAADLLVAPAILVHWGRRNGGRGARS